MTGRASHGAFARGHQHPRSRDLNEPVKRARAIDVIDQLGTCGELVLSAQCLNEFSSTSLRRGTPISEVRAAVSRWHDLGEVLSLTGPATSTALAAVERYRLSFWDALIWATVTRQLMSLSTP